MIDLSEDVRVFGSSPEGHRVADSTTVPRWSVAIDSFAKTYAAKVTLREPCTRRINIAMSLSLSSLEKMVSLGQIG